MAALVAAIAILPESSLAQSGGRRTADSLSVDRSARSRISDYFAEWKRAWMASEGVRHPFTATSQAWDVHCHGGELGTEWRFNEQQMEGRFIMSRETAFAVCPVWLSRASSGSRDESRVIDDALVEAQRPAIREARAELIRTLDSLHALFPASALLTDQRVRFRVDQQEYSGAVRAADECVGDAWRCASLSIYAHLSAGSLESAQRRATEAMAAVPCSLDMLRALLAPDDARRWERLRCPQRRDVAAAAWWLADPLWSDAPNERFLEQVRREVMLRVRTSLGSDERYIWAAGQGSDARGRMVLRYGWPSATYWPGPGNDESHAAHLQQRGNSPLQPPYTSYEYSSPRVSLVPSLTTILAPFDASHDALSPKVIGAPEPWTFEFTRTATPFTAIPEAQAIWLRRHDSIEVATAVETSPALLLRQLTSTAPVVLMLGDSPDRTRRAATATVSIGSTAVLRTRELARPVMVSLEIPADSATRAPAARSRFGFRLPPPLRDMKPGEIAVSAPVLLKPMSSEDLVPSHPDSALERMSGTTTVAPIGKIGIYWETYGLAPTDSVDLAVWIAKTDEPGLLRRVGRAVRIVPGAQTPVGVSWQETPPLRNVTVISDGPVPIIGRGLALDLTQLSPGEYWLEVAVARPGQEPVRGRRGFSIRAPD